MKKHIFLLILLSVMILFVSCFDDPEGESYTLRLEANGADNMEYEPPTELYEEEGNDITLPGPGDYTRLGFTFDGWNTNVDGSGTAYVEGDLFTMPAEACTLYAQWEYAPSSILYQDMVSISGGTWAQTTWQGYDTTTINHTLSSFQIAKYEVTYELWYIVRIWAELNGYTFEHDGEEGFRSAGFFPSENKYVPVKSISWYDAVVWCNAYSELTGLTPVYENADEEVIRDSRASNSTELEEIVWNLTADGFRLPTAGEWRYAASDRGTVDPDHAVGCSVVYTDTSTTKQYAWYNLNSSMLGQSHPDYGPHGVGTKYPNSLDIYDMSGNMSEWMWDWFGDYPTTDQTNYSGPATGTRKEILGGGWSSYGQSIVIGATSSTSYPETDCVGFRIAKNAD